MSTESLVELKKQRLLFMLQPTEGEEQVGVARPVEQSEERKDEAQNSSEEVSGMKCRAPLKEVCGIIISMQLIDISSQGVSYN